MSEALLSSAPSVSLHRCDGHHVRGDQRPEIDVRDHADVGDRRLEGAERTEARHGERVLVLRDERALIQHEAGGREHRLAVGRFFDPRGDLPEPPGDPHSAVQRVGLVEHGRREHRDAKIGRVGELQDVILETEPQVLGLIEDGCLWRGVRVREGRLARRARLGRGAPPWVAAPHEVPAIEVVVGVERRPGLLRRGHTRIEFPVAGALEVHQRGPVDVHGGRGGEPAIRVEHDREMRVRQIPELPIAERPRNRHRNPEEVRVVSRQCHGRLLASPSVCRFSLSRADVGAPPARRPPVRGPARSRRRPRRPRRVRREGAQPPPHRSAPGTRPSRTRQALR